LKAEFAHAVWPVDANADLPIAWLEQVELRGAKQLVRGRLDSCRILMIAAIGGFQAHVHRDIGRPLSGRGVLHEHADIDRPSAERRGRGEHRDAVAA
jgi:hypothetical protein